MEKKMRKPKIQNITTNASGAATNTGRNSGVLAGDASTPAFAKLSNINLRDKNIGRPGGLSALIGNASSAGGDIGNASRSASSDSGSKSGKQQIEENPNFARQSNAAWRASNPDGPKERKREVGFFAVARWVGGLTPTVTVYDLEFGEYGVNSITRGDNVMFNTPWIRDDERLIHFHTHPFTRAEGFNPNANRHDASILKPHAAGVIRNHSGHQWYGKFI